MPGRVLALLASRPATSFSPAEIAALLGRASMHAILSALSRLTKFRRVLHEGYGSYRFNPVSIEHEDHSRARRGTYIDRILSRVSYDHGCWTYTGKLSASGYGSLGERSGRASQRTHRAVYEAMVGSVPAGLELDHLCRNRACCNPLHLDPVSHAENMRRSNPRLFARSGDRHWRRMTFEKE